MLKSSTIKEEQFKEILMQLDNELRFRLAMNTYEKRMVIMSNNSSIHKTKAVKQLIKTKMNCIYYSILFSRVKSNWEYVWHIEDKNIKTKLQCKVFLSNN